jgi:selenocysteine lyase/cysteine desulfurase
MTVALACQRDLFEIPDEVTYLNAAAYVPLPRAVREAGQQGVLTKSHPWQMAGSHGTEISERARGAAAALLGTAADNVAITGAVSYGIATAARNLRIERGTRVLMIEGEFPSLALVWPDLAAAAGAVVEVVALQPHGDWSAALLAAIGRPGAAPVGLAALTPLHWSDGALIDLARVVPALQAQGARVVIDATQSVGVLDLDLAALKPDFLAFPTYKWVLGPYSLAFLYVAPEHQDGMPLENHGPARVAGSNSYIPSARRFDRGERNDPIGLPMAAVGLEQVLQWERPAVAARLRGLTDGLAEAVSGLPGISMLPRERRAPHILGLRFAGGMPAGLVERLVAQGVHVADRLGVMRVSPHVYNDERDVAAFASAVRGAIAA